MRECIVSLVRATTDTTPDSKTHSYELMIVVRGTTEHRFIRIADAKKLRLTMSNPGPIRAWITSNGDVSL